MLLRRGTLPLFLLLWLASAQSATLATLSQSTEEADTGEDTLTGRPGTEGQLARSEGTPGSSETLEPPPETGEPQEPQAETREAQEPQPDTGEPQEPQAETREAQEPQPDTGEPQGEAREAQEPQPDTEEPQEPKPDITLSEDVIATHKIESEAQDPSASALPDHPDTPDSGASLEEALFEQDWYQGPVKKAEESGWGLGALRSSFQTFNGYFDSMVELVGGRNGVCQYRCRHGLVPQPRPGYLQPEPDGCASSLVGMQFDLGIPAMTQCCDQLDSCYDTCGSSKYRCDSKFRWCLHSICTDLKKSLGFVSRVQACESGADALYNTVWSLGCRPYMNSQRAACVCAEEEREEL